MTPNRWLMLVPIVVIAAPARAQSASVQAQRLFDQGRARLRAAGWRPG
jgi:hypothetical protein